MRRRGLMSSPGVGLLGLQACVAGFGKRQFLALGKGQPIDKSSSR
jgi:hypothetical protein